MSRPKKNPGNERPVVSLRLSKATAAALDAKAAQAGTSRADLAERMIVAGLQKDGVDVAAVETEVRAARRAAAQLIIQVAKKIRAEMDKLVNGLGET